jgi:hypothetical protein
MTLSMSPRQHNLPGPGRARYRVEYVPGRGYVVVDPEGRIVRQPGNNKDQAIAARDSLQAKADTAARRGPRACLCCGQSFASEGIHNRLCNPCRTKSDPLANTSFAGGADGRKPRKAARV